jgi:TPR repeat protein
VAHNGAFTEKAKEYLGERDNLELLFDRIMREGTLTQQFNFGVILKDIGEVSKFLSCFYEASVRGSKRAQLELAYHNLETNVDTLSSISDVGPYGLWKVAQCFRYAKKVARNLKEANRYYLQALDGMYEFPEIAYDAGDFVEELALGQKDKGRFIETARKAIRYFRQAGEMHLGSGYIRAAQLMLKARERYPELAASFKEELICNLIFKAAQQGSYLKALELLKRVRLDPEYILKGRAALMGFIAEVNEKFG